MYEIHNPCMQWVIFFIHCVYKFKLILTHRAKHGPSFMTLHPSSLTFFHSQLVFPQLIGHLHCNCCNLNAFGSFILRRGQEPYKESITYRCEHSYILTVHSFMLRYICNPFRQVKLLKLYFYVLTENLYGHSCSVICSLS